jgi:hypothetical protein
VLDGLFPSRSADTRLCSWIVTFYISLYASLRIGSFGRFRTGMRGLSFQSIPR